ncbi:hypothetical protein [Streptomyces sp. NPDC003006]
MMTTRSPFGVRRTGCAPRTSRLWWLGALLLAVLYAHGIGVEGASAHTTPAIVTSSIAVDRASESAAGHADTSEPASDGSRGHGHDEGSSHAAGECLSGQPQDGPSLAAPCVSALGSAFEYGGPGGGITSSGGSGPEAHAPPPSQQAAVLRT